MSSGWQSNLPTFRETKAGIIQQSLENFVRDFSPQQANAWRESIPMLQKEAGELIDGDATARQYSAVLEYQLPYDGRRPDVVILANGAIVVLELKGKQSPNQADLDQVSAYARDLRAYHRECHNKPVTPILVPTRSSQLEMTRDGVLIAAPDRLDEVVRRLASEAPEGQILLENFTAEEAYSPLPTLVEAARELFESRTIREIWRAKAATDPAVDTISRIAHEAVQTESRHLVLVTGVPGAGKTLVGMRAVHAKYLDDLAVVRANGKPTVPGLYLTGNGPLAEVLQYELKKAGGGGSTFVRHIKQYLNSYVPKPQKIPPEHLLVFDEAQRAFNSDKVEDTHKDWNSDIIKSEPELFIDVCDRMPQWSVMVGLIGGGQEIHLGEEEGLKQWRDALQKSDDPQRWTVHCPRSLSDVFDGSGLKTNWDEHLNLDTEIRFHQSTKLNEFVDELLVKGNLARASQLASFIQAPSGDYVDGMKMYLTRDLELAKSYLRERYAEAPQARYGIIASSRDKALNDLGITNDWQSKPRIGPWFSEGEENSRSCRHLEDTISEFDCQGLELEMSLLAWGTDFMRERGKWTARKAKGYRPRGKAVPRNPYQMRVNAYRVLLTRGRDGTIVYVPRQLSELDETFELLENVGFKSLV
ncbi:MAG: DNA/RNA helicase domain-containing protein [Candidatus Hydrogenedentota bacterium]